MNSKKVIIRMTSLIFKKEMMQNKMMGPLMIMSLAIWLMMKITLTPILLIRMLRIQTSNIWMIMTLTKLPMRIYKTI